jgi:hypothetical protein
MANLPDDEFVTPEDMNGIYEGEPDSDAVSQKDGVQDDQVNDEVEGDE